MIVNKADAIVVVEEQAQTIKDLRAEIGRLRTIVAAARTRTERQLLDGYGCPFCKRDGGQYVDDEYWHDDDCVYELLVPRLKLPSEEG